MPIILDGTTGITTPGLTNSGSDSVVDLSVSGNTTIGDASSDNLTINGSATFATTNPTLTAGTANGVLYLNGSKVATSGSALTFNGTNLTIGSGGKLLYSNVSYGVGIDPDGSGGFGAGYNFETNGGTPRYLVTGPVSGQYISSGSVPFVAWYLGSSAASGTAAPEQMRLTSTGLGIGTSSPGYKLDVNGTFGLGTGQTGNIGVFGANTATADTYFRIRNTAGNFEMGTASGGHYLYGQGSLPIQFFTNGTERMRLDSSGGLGINLSDPSTYGKLAVAGTIAQWNNVSSGSELGRIQWYNTATNYDVASIRTIIGAGQVNRGEFAFYTNNGASQQVAMYIDRNQNVGIGTSSLSGNGRLELNVPSGNNTNLTFYENGSSRWLIGSVTGSNVFRFYDLANATERMRIDSSGRLLIGNTTPYDNATLSVTSASQLYSVISDGGTTGNRSRGGFAHPAAKVFALNVDQADGVLAFYQNGNTERGRFSSTGNLCIGTSSDSTGISGLTAKLVVGTTNVSANNFAWTAKFHQTGSYADNAITALGFSVEPSYTRAAFGYVRSPAGYDVGSFAWYLASDATAPGTTVAYTDEKMRLDYNGNLMIGQTSRGLRNSNSFDFDVSDASAYFNHVSGTVTGSTYIYFGYNSSNIGSITQNGVSQVLYNVSSDYRLKNIIGPVANSGAYIDSLKPVEGTWKADGSTFVGLIAHEAQEVSRTQIATGEKDGEQMQGMDYSNSEFIANIIAELQSLRKRVAQLESK